MQLFLLTLMLLSIAAMFLTPFPKLITEKIVNRFSYLRVYVFCTFLASFCFLLLGATSLAYAQDPTTEAGVFQYLLENLLNFKQMAPAAVALVVSKAILFAFNTPKLGQQLDKLTGKMKLLVSLILTYVVGVLSVMLLKHVELPVALFDSANIPLLGLLLNQIYKQFVVKGEEPPKVKG